MADSYTKLFGTITDSTIWSESDATRIVWITMLAMCDKDGIVSAAVPGLAARARVGMPECISALKKFLSPDQWSRTPDHEGRRIEAVPGGWRLLNHAKYRAIMSAETRREQSRVAMQKLRDEAKKATNVSNSLATVSNVDGALAVLTHTDTDTDTYPDTNTKADTNTEERPNTDCAGPKLPALTVGAKPPTVPRPRKLRTVEPSKTASTWESYSNAYQDRYGVPPTRNAMVNGQMSRFCQRIGADESPVVAAFYVRHNDLNYVKNGHSVGLLLHGAEKLRTEWATNRQITTTRARQIDASQANFDVAEECRRLDREEGIVRTFGGVKG